MKKIILRFLLKFKILRHLNFTFTLIRDGRNFEIPLIGNVGSEYFFNDKEGWMQAVLDTLNKITNSKGIFVDVGVNIGQTLVKVKSFPRHWDYIGFEPNPNCLQYLYTLVNKNGFTNITLLPFGLSDKMMAGNLSFFSSDPVDSYASVVDGFRSGVHTSIPVTLVDGEQVFDLFKDPVSVVKIDVEGGELEVIRGLRSVIQRDRPFIICEILPVYNGENYLRHNRQVELEDILRDLDYLKFRIHPDGFLSDCPQIGIHNSMEDINYLFCPASAHDVIKASLKVKP